MMAISDNIKNRIRSVLKKNKLAVNTAEVDDIELFNSNTRYLLSKEGLDLSLQKALTNHLYYIHNARLKAVRTLLPAAKNIIDLGGANAPLYEMGYPHSFEHLVMVDLPIDERHKEFRKEVHSPRASGKVEILYSDMTELTSVADSTFDFAWSGQSIEHITKEQGVKMLKEVYRVLKPGGYFALDTPNRMITKIHTSTGGNGGFIHPDHKIEYYYEELKELLESHKFVVEDQRGICEMPLSFKDNYFHYEDFVLGNPISDRINSSYILYFLCRKA